MYIFNGYRLYRNSILSLFCYGVFAYERSRLAYAHKHCLAALRAVYFHRRSCFTLAKPSSANGTSYIFHSSPFPLLTNVLYLSNCLARSGCPSLQLNFVCKRRVDKHFAFCATSDDNHICTRYRVRVYTLI